MRSTTLPVQTAAEIVHYFSQSLPSKQDTMGQIVSEVLLSGKTLNRKAICAKLLKRLEMAGSASEEQHYHELISLLLGHGD